jgi:hypothetical protein
MISSATLGAEGRLEYGVSETPLIKLARKWPDSMVQDGQRLESGVGSGVNEKVLELLRQREYHNPKELALDARPASEMWGQIGGYQ